MIRGLVLGVSIHDLPLVRTLAPTFDRVGHAEFIAPFGGVISLMAGERRVALLAFMRPAWQPDWRFEAWAEDRSLSVSFTPSFVHAGPASVTIRDSRGERRMMSSGRASPGS